MARSSIFCLAVLASIAGALGAPRADAQAVLLDFTSTSCPPCQQMRPVLEQLAASGRQVRAVDVHREPEAARQYRITATPTFVIMVNGREQARAEGVLSAAQLAEMMDRSVAKAAHSDSVRGQSPTTGGGVNLAANVSSPSGAPATFAQGPTPERVVEIQQPMPPSVAAGRERAGAAAVPSMAPEPAVDGELAARLVAATVRLSIQDPGGRSTGTGVIIDARSGEALVLTCGHLFRESAGKGAIEISTFVLTPSGVEKRQTLEGVLMAYDLERDLAVVRIRPTEPPAVAPVAPLGARLEPGDAVTSVGCNHGENPSPWATRITAINRYQGHPNVEAARAPVEGRSGGGLFNAQGQVIGICYAAEPKGDEGLYASLSSIQAKLDELQLSVVYQSPSGAGPAGAGAGQLASAVPQAPMAVRGQDRADSLPAGLNDNWPMAAVTTPEAATPAPTQAQAQAPLSPFAQAAAPTQQQPAPAAAASLAPTEQAALEELGRRAANSEIICIIRPQTPGGRSEVIKLNTASPEFVRALGGGVATAAAPGPILR